MRLLGSEVTEPPAYPQHESVVIDRRTTSRDHGANELLPQNDLELVEAMILWAVALSTNGDRT
jgi:hypothetical protein